MILVFFFYDAHRKKLIFERARGRVAFYTFKTMSDDRIDERKENFKKGITSEGVTDRRVASQASLRKNARRKKLEERRQRRVALDPQIQAQVDTMQVEVEQEGDGTAVTTAQQRVEEARQAALVVTTAQDWQHPDFGPALRQLCALTMSAYAPYLEPVLLNAQLLYRLAQTIAVPDAQVADAALIILTNVTLLMRGVEHCFSAGVFPMVAGHLLRPDLTTVPTVLQSSAAWLVGNMVSTNVRVQVGEGVFEYARDVAVHMGIADMIGARLEQCRQSLAENLEYIPQEKEDLLRNGYWALCNFFKGDKPPMWSKMAIPLREMREAIFDPSPDGGNAGYGLWAMFIALSDPTNVVLVEQVLCDQPFVGRIAELAQDKSPDAVLPALRILAELACYEPRLVPTPEHPEGVLQCPPLADVLWNANIMNALLVNIDNPLVKLRREVCFIVGNLALTNYRYVQKLCETGLMHNLLSKCEQERAEVHGEAQRAMCNVTQACILGGRNPGPQVEMPGEPPARLAWAMAHPQHMYTYLLHDAGIIYKVASGMRHQWPGVREECTRLLLSCGKRGAVTNLPCNNAQAIAAMVEESGAYRTMEQMLTNEPMAKVADLAEKTYEFFEPYVEGDDEGAGMGEEELALPGMQPAQQMGMFTNPMGTAVQPQFNF